MFTTSIYKQLNSRIEYTKVGESCHHPGVMGMDCDDNPNLMCRRSEIRFLFRELLGVFELRDSGAEVASICRPLGERGAETDGAASAPTPGCEAEVAGQDDLHLHYVSGVQ